MCTMTCAYTTQRMYHIRCYINVYDELQIKIHIADVKRLFDIFYYRQILRSIFENHYRAKCIIDNNNCYSIVECTFFIGNRHMVVSNGSLLIIKYFCNNYNNFVFIYKQIIIIISCKWIKISMKKMSLRKSKNVQVNILCYVNFYKVIFL